MDDKLTISQTEALFREAQARAQEAEARKREAEIWAEIARRGGASAPPGSIASVDAVVEIAKLPLTDAVIWDLKQSKTPKTPQQIWRSLEAAGYEASSDTPEESVKWALKKLVMRGDPDIVHVGWNAWHLRSRYATKAKLERLIKRRAGKGGRSTEDHVARTLEGMEKAKARGKLGHRPSKLNDKNVVTFKEMLVSGASNSAIAKALGISVATVYARRRDVESWNIGEPWPPSAEKPADETEPSHIRLVKS
jgi:transposase